MSYYNEYTENPLPDSTERIKVSSVPVSTRTDKQLFLTIGGAKVVVQARRASAPLYSNTTSIETVPMVEVFLDPIHPSGLHESAGCGDYSHCHLLHCHRPGLPNWLAHDHCRTLFI